MVQGHKWKSGGEKEMWGVGKEIFFYFLFACEKQSPP
jgi:hypothetical protein